MASTIDIRDAVQDITCIVFADPPPYVAFSTKERDDVVFKITRCKEDSGYILLGSYEEDVHNPIRFSDITALIIALQRAQELWVWNPGKANAA